MMYVHEYMSKLNFLGQSIQRASLHVVPDPSCQLHSSFLFEKLANCSKHFSPTELLIEMFDLKSLIFEFFGGFCYKSD